MIKVSIIIINYNTGDYLKRCLLSIQRSTFPSKDYEVIIVDNNSKDNSLKVALSIKGINLYTIRNDQNIGFAKANNQAIKKAAGDYILLLNPDTILEKETLKIMLKYMDNYKGVAISTPRIELPDGTLDDACHRGFPTPLNSLFHFTTIERLFPASPFFNGYHLGYQKMDIPHEIDSCVGAFMLIRKQVGDDLGWFDEDYFWYGEDLDFCYRAKQKGNKVMFIPNTKITHFKGISSGIKNHSRHLSIADRKTRLRSTQARFDVMRTFYQKHYADKYPKLLTSLVLLGVLLKEKLSVNNLRN